jgi:SNF2-related domain/Helicase conserved C-terminal domain
MLDSPRKEFFPNNMLAVAERRRWVRLDPLECSNSTDQAVLRVFVLPEDINRAARASVKDLRRVIKWLLTLVDTSKRTWRGEFDPTAPPDLYGVPSADHDESLFYIFNTLDSPTADVEGFVGSRYAEVSMDSIVYDDMSGLTTQLYPYQKRSVCAMLRREEDPAKSPDQRKPRYTDLESNPFHMDVFDGIITQNPHLYVEPRGGVLAETMGYGKTLACLALILATRGHYPHVPEGRIETRSTPVLPKTSSLLGMAARALVHAGVPWKADFHARKQAGDHYDHIVSELKMYSREFAEPIFHPTTPDRKASKREADRTLRLCYGTLVIVPPNLVTQWQVEIAKHVQTDALDVLVLSKVDEEIPSWRELMGYDIVLIAKNRLEKEYRDNDLNDGKRYACQPKYRSSLTELRWLRIICDEGHDFAGSSSTNAMDMLSKLSVERRWIISGTPSGSVYGVEVNLAATGDQSSPRKHSLNKALEQRRLPDSVKQEKKDMEKLQTIVTHFLNMSPWANQQGSDHASWKKYLAPFDNSGQRRCAPGLRLLLQSLMVRHRIEELEVDVPLPDLHNRTVYLEPSYYDKLSLNLFMLDLTVNAVTSERTDEDYMFHSRNRKALDLLVSNLRQSTFHWVGFCADGIVETMRVGNKYFDNNLDKIPDSDALLLTRGLMSGEQALDDPGWRAFSTFHEVGVYIENFPGTEDAAQAWALHGELSKPVLLGTTQARAVQNFILSSASQQETTAGLVGAGLRVMNESRKKAEEETKTKKEKAVKATENTGRKNTPAGVTEEITLSRSVRASARLMNPFRKRSRSNSGTRPASVSADMLQALSGTRIIGFTSAKLTYLCSQLLEHSPTCKSIVFYDSSSPNIAFWLAEALELLSIPHHIYASGLKQELRSKYLREFNTDEKYRVLVMDLKQASLGLHIAVASRVYIVSPIWSPSIEAQAIKRAHRIGQTKEVYIETLVLKGTIEERMWKRRKGMSEKEQRSEAKGGWLDDEGICGIIKAEGFLKIDEEREKNTGDGSERGEDGGKKTRVKESAKVARLDVPHELFFRESRMTPNIIGLDIDGRTADRTNSGGGDSDQERSKKKKRRVGGVRFDDESESGPSTKMAYRPLAPATGSGSNGT